MSHESSNILMPMDADDSSELEQLKPSDRETLAERATRYLRYRQLFPRFKYERPKIAARYSRWKQLWPILIQLLPVAVTFGILSLSLRRSFFGLEEYGMYLSSRSSNAINEALGLLQVAAKAHEILITLSLSSLVFYYLRRQLLSAGGLPFGLFTSAYRVSLGIQPFSIDYINSWRGVFGLKPLRFAHIQWRLIGLSLLVLLASILALVAGPASANVLLPRLDWWLQRENLFLYRAKSTPQDEGTEDYSIYFVKDIFPSKVDASSLPGEYCISQGSDTDGLCPYAGLHAFLESALINFTIAGNNGMALDNITLPSSLGRPSATLILVAPGQLPYATGWASNYVLSDYVSMGWKLIEKIPYTIDMYINEGGVPSPEVRTICETKPATEYERNITHIWDPTTPIPEAYKAFDIRGIWNESLLKFHSEAPSVHVEFRDLSTNGDPNPMLGAFMLLSANGRDHNQSEVVMCGITATWLNNKMWTVSNGPNSLVTDFDYFGVYNKNTRLLSGGMLPFRTPAS